MPKAIEVTPKKWKDISVLFDNGTFSVIIGRYDQYEKLTLACRWNGNQDDVGYPKLFSSPVWFNLPESFAFGLLLTVRGELVKAIDQGTISDSDFNLLSKNLRQAESDLKAGK